jgi:hypothetical protein
MFRQKKEKKGKEKKKNKSTMIAMTLNKNGTQKGHNKRQCTFYKVIL